MTSSTFAAWPYRLDYAIADPPTYTGTPPLRLTIPWRIGMRTDFGDLRFHHEDFRVCPYWIESYTAGVEADVWVNLYTAQARLLVPYGNAAATSEADGAAVFTTFDDFAGASLDTETWTDLGGTTVSGGLLEITGASEAEVYGVRSVDAFGVGTVVRMRLSASGAFGGVWAGFMADESSYAVVKYLANETVITRHAGGSVTSTAMPMAAGYHVVEVARQGSTSVLFLLDDGATARTHATNVPTADLPIAVLSNLALSLTYVDWIALYPYVADPPTASISPVVAENPWYVRLRQCEPYPEWPYSIEYTIADAPIYHGYPVAITVAYRPGMRQDFRDLRFRDPATLEANDLFCEDYISGVSAEVALALHPGQTRVEILYGNGAAESVSDGEAVYPDFFDPFDGSILDGAAWNSGGQVAVSGGIATVRSSSASYISSKTAIPLGYAVRARANLGNGTNWIGLEATAGDTNSNNLDEVDTTYVRYGNGSTYGETAHSLTLSAAYHTLDIARYPGHTRFAVDGTVKWDETTILSTAARYPVVHGYSVPTLVDWIAVRPCSAVEPTLSYVRMGINPWAFLADRSAVLAALGAGPGITTTDINDEDIISYTVRRSSSDVMYSADVTIHDLIPQGTNFTRVKLIEPDHNGVDRLIFFGFLPAQTSTIQAAKNSTNYKGWDYGYFIAGRDPGMSFCTMPSSTASPGAYLKAIFDASGQWPDLADPSRNLFDTSHIDVDAPAAWNTAALPARDIVVPTSSKLMALCQKIATDTGTIFYVKWDDIGTTPAIGHSDPAYQIVRKEAEDYDEGGYYDTTAANLGGAYRKDGVDIEYFASEAGYNVGWIRDGEWMQYTVNFPAVDTYVARFRTASAAATGARSFKVYIDGALVDTISVDGTGSYSAFAWNTDTCDIVIGTAGDHVIKLLFDNAGDDVADLLHMNIASMEFTPTPTISGTVPSTTVPAIYYCDEADLDDALGLPVIEIPPYDPTLAGAVKYVEDSADLANAVIVRYRQPSAPDTLLETGDPWIFTGDGTYNGLELPIDHVETVETPITTATAEALRDALKAYFAEDWGTVTASFIRRPDLQLFQRLWFRGHAQIPEYEDDGTTPVLFRIVDISYSVGLARCDVSITAVPVRKFSIERQIARTRAPDPATEIEAIARSVLKSLPPALTGTAGSAVGTGSVAVALDRGGTITARGVAASGSRVLCTWAEGIGYVASVIAAA